MLQFNEIDLFFKSSEQKVDLFWNTIWGDKKTFWKENGTFLLFFLSFVPLFVGVAALIERWNKGLPFFFWGVESYALTLPHVPSLLFNVLLWISYFSLGGAFLIGCFAYLRFLGDDLEKAYAHNNVKLQDRFSPIETVIYSSYRMSEELSKYAAAVIPSDLGLGGDLDWIEGCVYKVLSGRRRGSYSGPSTKTNSFFVDLGSKEDVIQRLDLYSWYTEKDVERDEIIIKLFKLRDYVLKCGPWHDFLLGVNVYKAISQTFLFAHLRNKESFRNNLEATLLLHEEYQKTRNPLKGIPYFLFKLGPKFSLFLLGSFFLLLAAVFIYFIPEVVVWILRGYFNVELEITPVRGVFGILGAWIGVVVLPILKDYFLRLFVSKEIEKKKVTIRINGEGQVEIISKDEDVAVIFEYPDGSKIEMLEGGEEN